MPQKRGVTLIELVVAISIIAVTLGGLFAVVKRGNVETGRARQEVIAINLARQGMEAVYNMRNTNRQRRAGKKDQCRLKTNPMTDESGVGCADDQWLGSGYYIISGASNAGEMSRYASGVAGAKQLNLSQGLTGTDNQFTLCLSGDRRYPCPGSTGIYTKEGVFTRQLIGQWLFAKAKDNTTVWGVPLTCPTGNTSTCGDSSAKEYRFCVLVQYSMNTVWQVQMCGVLTNFSE